MRLVTVTFNLIGYTSCLPEFVQEALYCESGWSVSVWKWSPFKIVVECGQPISSRKGLYILDPLLHGISCCLIDWSCEIKLLSSNYDLPGKPKSGLIWYEMIAIMKWIHSLDHPAWSWASVVLPWFFQLDFNTHST